VECNFSKILTDAFLEISVLFIDVFRIGIAFKIACKYLFLTSEKDSKLPLLFCAIYFLVRMANTTNVKVNIS